MLFLSCKKIICHMKKTLQGKAYLLLFIIFVVVIIDSCKKDSRTDYENLQKELSETSTAAIIRAREVFINQSVDNRVQLTGKSLLSDSLLNHRTLLWSDAYTNISGDTVFVFVPVKIPGTLTVEQGDLAGTRLTDHLFLRMIDYGNGFKPMLTEMVSMIPDDSSGWNITQKFSGLLLLENWYSPFSSFINVLNGKESPHSKKIMSSGGATTEGYFDCKTLPVTLCVGVEGYMECDTHLVTTCQGGPGGGGGGTGGGGTGGGGVPPRGPSGPGGGGGGGSAGGKNSNKDIIDSLRGYPCAQALLAKIKTPVNTDIGNLIKNTFAKNDLVNITFSADRNLIGTNTDGAEQTGNNSKLTAEFFIGLNPDILMKSSQEYILVTMYHEALHAFFGRKLQTLGVVEFNRQYEGVNVSGGRLLGVNNDAHIPMAYQNYVKGLKDIIMAFNPNFNEDRAWILAKTGIIQNLPEESKINDQERDTTKPGYTGTKCP